MYIYFYSYGIDHKSKCKQISMLLIIVVESLIKCAYIRISVSSVPENSQLGLAYPQPVSDWT